jgi:hypothetical protein
MVGASSASRCAAHRRRPDQIGVGFLRGLGTPLPPPPPAGEMRRVNLRYRCSICGTELKMMLATDELPEPPRHCQEDMDLMTPVE